MDIRYCCAVDSPLCEHRKAIRKRNASLKPMRHRTAADDLHAMKKSHADLLDLARMLLERKWDMKFKGNRDEIIYRAKQAMKDAELLGVKS